MYTLFITIILVAFIAQSTAQSSSDIISPSSSMDMMMMNVTWSMNATSTMMVNQTAVVGVNATASASMNYTMMNSTSMAMASTNTSGSTTVQPSASASMTSSSSSTSVTAPMSTSTMASSTSSSTSTSPSTSSSSISPTPSSSQQVHASSLAPTWKSWEDNCTTICCDGLNGLKSNLQGISFNSTRLCETFGIPGRICVGDTYHMNTTMEQVCTTTTCKCPSSPGMAIKASIFLLFVTIYTIYKNIS